MRERELTEIHVNDEVYFCVGCKADSVANWKQLQSPIGAG